MTKNDWHEAGDQIKRLVQDAVDSKNFSQLSSTITNVVNETVNGLQSALKDNFSQKPNSYKDFCQRTNREAAEKIRENIERKRQAKKDKEHWALENGWTNVPGRMKVKVPGELSGQLMKWIGYSMSGMFGLAWAILLLVAIVEDEDDMLISIGILTILFVMSMVFGKKGSIRVRLASRFRRYKAVLGVRTYCLVEELAAAIGKSQRFVQKDLKKMIEQGFFSEGYLARQETLFITDSGTYQQYLGTQAEYERRAMREEIAEERSAKAEDTKTEEQQPEQSCQQSEAGLNPKCREIIEEGKRYIQHIHDCNEKIPGQEISVKLDRLELVITRIFWEAEKNPDAADELKKMMSYYLPTTKKLLDAYCEMDAQPIAGQNIESTKEEIENALDTINTAFENLLDSFFEEKAWDISSDITVLHTMLAQEGLTGTAFEQKDGGKKNE